MRNYAGHFFPEEDDKFLERVQAAVEEEERQAVAAADTDAAKDAIATAEESRKTIRGHGRNPNNTSSDKGGEDSKNLVIETECNKSTSVTVNESGPQRLEGQGFGGAYDSVANLPLEFYHYYHGSNTDMGTLIEVILTSPSSSFYIPFCLPSTLCNLINFLIFWSIFPLFVPRGADLINCCGWPCNR